MTSAVVCSTSAEVRVPTQVPATAGRGEQLRPRQERFAQFYAEHGNATRAYRQAFRVRDESAANIRQKGYAMLHRPQVAARVRALLAAAAETTTVSARARLVRLQEIAEADPSELVRVVADACRWCHGAAHAYQWIDAAEYAQALRVAVAANQAHERARRPARPLPTDEGGYGYEAHREPHSDCPRCHGEGSPRVVVTPTDQLSASARKLLKGVRQKRTGEIEVQLHNQLDALDMLNRAQGVYVERSLSVTAHVAVPPIENWSPEQRLAFLESLKAAGA